MRSNLADLVRPWMEELTLPKGFKMVPWPLGPNDVTLKGEAHWYVYSPTKDLENWLVTVRADHVEVRDDNDEGPMTLNWHTLSAADPEFFAKLERDIRAAIDYLVRN